MEVDRIVFQLARNPDMVYHYQGYHILPYPGETLSSSETDWLGHKMIECLGEEFIKLDTNQKVALLGYQLYNLFHPDEEVRKKTDYDLVLDERGKIVAVMMVYTGSRYVRCHCLGPKDVNLTYLEFRSKMAKNANGNLPAVVSTAQFTIKEIKDFFGNKEIGMVLHKDAQTGVDHVLESRMMVNKGSFESRSVNIDITSPPGFGLRGPVVLGNEDGSEILQLLDNMSPRHSFDPSLMQHERHLGYLDTEDRLVVTCGRKNPVNTPWGPVAILTDLATDDLYTGYNLGKALRCHDLTDLVLKYPDVTAASDVETRNLGLLNDVFGYKLVGQSIWFVAEQAKFAKERHVPLM